MQNEAVQRGRCGAMQSQAVQNYTKESVQREAVQKQAVQRRQVRSDFASFEPAYPCLREVSKDYYYYEEEEEENLTRGSN